MNVSEAETAEMVDYNLEIQHYFQKSTMEKFDWDGVAYYLYIAVFVLALLGIGLNCLCFRTCLFLTRANSTASILMRYLAAWDSVALMHNLLDHGLNRLLGTGWICKSVCEFLSLSCCFHLTLFSSYFLIDP